MRPDRQLSTDDVLLKLLHGRVHMQQHSWLLHLDAVDLDAAAVHQARPLSWNIMHLHPESAVAMRSDWQLSTDLPLRGAARLELHQREV